MSTTMTIFAVRLTVAGIEPAFGPNEWGNAMSAFITDFTEEID